MVIYTVEFAMTTMNLIFIVLTTPTCVISNHLQIQTHSSRYGIHLLQGIIGDPLFSNGLPFPVDEHYRKQ
jgi:hypothetical protein